MLSTTPPRPGTDLAGLNQHSPSLAFLVDFANILLGESILLGDLEGNSRVSLPEAITGFIHTLYHCLLGYKSNIYQENKENGNNSSSPR